VSESLLLRHSAFVSIVAVTVAVLALLAGSQKAVADYTFVRSVGSIGSGNGQFNNPAAVAVDASGNVWVADIGNNRIQEFSGSGVYLQQFGSQGSGNGQFNHPAALAVDTLGNVWVADIGNNRIQEFAPITVPEPSTLVLLTIGAIGLLACTRRQRKTVL
jgi:secreted PhoX family phosphatase